MPSFPATPTPTGVTAVQEGPTSVTVSWTQISGTEYWIYYASAGGEDSGSTNPNTGTSQTLNNLLDGLIYTITVIAVGEHLPSEEVAGTYFCAKSVFLYFTFVVIVSPNSLTSTSQTQTTITISWNHISNNMISYEVSYIYQGPCSGVVDSGTETVTGLQYTLMGLEEFSTYMITVRAVYNGMKSESDNTSATTLPSGKGV